MTIQWLGHSCFLITAKDGRTLLTDPFDETVGYPVPGVPANVVTCSHDHFDHHATASLPNGYTIVDQPGVHHTHGFVVEGFMTFHDGEGGRQRGVNIVFKTEVDGLKLAHLGDLGHLLSPAQLQTLGEVDVLFLPVGGRFTIDAAQAAALVEQVKPKIAIPMHYKTRYLRMEISDERGFVESFDHTYLKKDTIELTPQTISDYPQVVVLEYA